MVELSAAADAGAQVLERGLEAFLEDGLVEVDRAAAAGADEHRVGAQEVAGLRGASSDAATVEHDDVAGRGALGERGGDDAAHAPAAQHALDARVERELQPVGERVDGEGRCPVPSRR